MKSIFETILLTVDEVQTACEVEFDYCAGEKPSEDSHGCNDIYDVIAIMTRDKGEWIPVTKAREAEIIPQLIAIQTLSLAESRFP